MTVEVCQPPLSRAIQQLEAHVGAPLLDRTMRPLRLTEVGRLLHAQAVQLLARMEDVDTMVKTAATSRSMVGDRRRWCMARPNIVTARL